MRLFILIITLILLLLLTSSSLGKQVKIGNKICTLVKSGKQYINIETEEYEHSNGKKELRIICKYEDNVTDKSTLYTCGDQSVIYTAAVISGSVFVTFYCEKPSE